MRSWEEISEKLKGITFEDIANSQKGVFCRTISDAKLRDAHAIVTSMAKDAGILADLEKELDTRQKYLENWKERTEYSEVEDIIDAKLKEIELERTFLQNGREVVACKFTTGILKQFTNRGMLGGIKENRLIISVFKRFTNQPKPNENPK